MGCSTAGEIIGTQVLDGTLTTTAIYFEHTTIENFSVKVKNFEDSYEAGAMLAEKLNEEHLFYHKTCWRRYRTWIEHFLRYHCQ